MIVDQVLPSPIGQRSLIFSVFTAFLQPYLSKKIFVNILSVGDHDISKLCYSFNWSSAANSTA